MNTMAGGDRLVAGVRVGAPPHNPRIFMDLDAQTVAVPWPNASPIPARASEVRAAASISYRDGLV